MDWNLGILLISSLLVLMVIEIELCILTNREYANSPTKKGTNVDIGPESKEYNSRALVFAGLNFAGITLLISSSEDLNLVQSSLTIFTYSLSLFFISYKMEVFTGLKRKYWIIQEKTLNYGFLAITIGIATHFYEKLQSLFFIGILLFITVYTMHLLELKSDLELYNDVKQHKK